MLLKFEPQKCLQYAYFGTMPIQYFSPLRTRKEVIRLFCKKRSRESSLLSLNHLNLKIAMEVNKGVNNFVYQDPIRAS